MHRALLPVLLLTLASCAQNPSKKDLEAREASFEQSLDGLRDYQSQLETENARLNAENEGLRVDIERARAASAREASVEVERGLSELDERIKQISLVATGDVEFVDGPNGPVLRIRDKILFSSGKHQVTDSGASIIRSLAGELAPLGRHIRVEGHSDNVPVKRSASTYPRGNLQLSAQRAVEVAALLIDGGIAADWVSATGYGEWRPLTANDSAGGRATNRRVEIVIGARAGN